MKSRNVLMAVGFMLLLTTTAYGQYNWPMANGNPELSSFARNEKILTPPFSLVRDIPFSATYMSINGRFMVGGTGPYQKPNTVQMLELSSGAVLWTFEVPGTTGSIAVIPALSDSLVFCSGQNSKTLYALELMTGKIRWEKTFKEVTTYKNPIIDRERLYFICDSLYCMNALTGAVIWKQMLNWTQMTPAIDDSTVYVVSRPLVTKTCWAFNKYTGEKRWEAENDGNYLLTVDRKYVYLNNGRDIVARDKRNGKIILSYTLPQNYVLVYWSPSAAALTDDFLCISVSDTALDKGHLLTLHRADLSFAWDQAVDSRYFYNPTIANGVVYCIEQYGRFFGFELSSGNIVFQDTTAYFSSQALVANHSLYIMTGGNVRIYTNPRTGVDEKSVDIPEQLTLAQNFPNPFNASTAITFDLPNRTHVDLTVYNVMGQAVTKLVDAQMEPGSHQVAWSADGCESGIYFIRLTSADYSVTKNATLIR